MALDHVIDYFEFGPWFADIVHLIGVDVDVDRYCLAKNDGQYSDQSDINGIVHLTQEYMFARQPWQERWQVDKLQWIDDHASELYDIIIKSGLCTAKMPEYQKYHAVVMLGATKAEMEKRTGWFVDLIKNKHLSAMHIYAATGERYANIPKGEASYLSDGSIQYLEYIAEHCSHNKDIAKVTEAQMSAEILTKHLAGLPYSLDNKEAWGNFGPDQEYEQKIVILNTPKGEKSRPNTIDTMVELYKTLKERNWDGVVEDYHMLIVSRSPNTLAQRMQIETIFAQLNQDGSEHKIIFDVAGGSCNADLSPDSSSIRQALMPLAGYMRDKALAARHL